MRAFSVAGQIGLADVTADEQDAVRGLGFERRGAVFVRSFDALTPAIADRFEQHAEAVVRQALRIEPVPWREALGLLRTVDAEWTLVGSAARALRGEDVAPRDLDLVASVAECERLAAALDHVLIEPLCDGGFLGERWFRAFAGARIECVGGPAFPVVDLETIDGVRVGRVG